MSDLNTFADSLLSSSAVKEFAGDEITVSIGGNTSSAFYATVQQDQRQIDDVNGQLILWDGFAIQCEAADLVINAIQVLPVAGMRIAHGTKTYEVQPPNANQQCYETQLGGLRLVIYAVQVP